MKIIRNGITYQLTHEEMREAYKEMKLEYLKEDIECTADEMGIELSSTTMDYVVDRVDKCLGNNDSYMESYWMTIEQVLEEQLED